MEMKSIKGYENLYAVDSEGNVYSLVTNNSRRKGRLKPSENGCGYLRVQLYKNKKAKKFYIHRLVAEHFLENPMNYKVVNHKDGNKYNNSVENLEWCTQKQNIEHSWRLGLQKGIGENHGMAKLKLEEVKEIRNSFKTNQSSIIEFSRIMAKKYNVATSTIAGIIYGLSWKGVG